MNGVARKFAVALGGMLAGAIAVSACAKKEKKDDKTSATVSINALVLGSAPAFANGSSTAEGLKALKYMISSISICNDLEANGSGFNNPTGCSSIYQKDLPGDLADSTKDVSIETIKAMQNGEYAEHQIDLMDDASRSKLNVEGKVEVGTYNYAIITWASPIQFNAEVDVAGVKIYSKGTTSYGDNRSQSKTTEDVRVAPAADGVVLSPNGGTYFKFPKAFVVGEADIEAGETYVIDLVFNPDGVIRATDDPVNFSMSSWFKGETGAMYVPMLSLSPVPRKASDTNTKEIYEVTDASDQIYRLELYYNTSDAEKAILGASMVSLTSGMSDDYKIKQIETTDEKLNFTSTATEGPGSGAGGLLSGFVRGASCTGTKIIDVDVASCALKATLEAK